MDEFSNNVFPVDISKEMKESYLQYSMSVIVGRALPDVRDGLKPVHRRILYAMRDLGNTYDKPYKKSARVVGDVIGKYHPHGEAAVYDSIVRMAQDFSMNHILVDGQGNFGSVDGDTAAASRYTEIRMTELAGELLLDIEKDTCDFEWNYDDSLLIPKVLPSRVPNLLINGSSGIAVGMASNIPPHNLGEVVQACISLLDKDLTVEEIFKIIPGPDFPTAGSIIGQSGILKAYREGRGAVRMRAKADVEKEGLREQIIITEIPYQVNKSMLIENIAAQVRDKALEGIADIRDESSREGMRIVIVLKKQENAQVILNNLYKQTRLQTSFGMNLLALDREGRPQTFSIKNILKAFLAHRRDVITRRLVFELNKAQDRMHILEGLTKALDHLDAVLSLIRNSKETVQAREGLMKSFELSSRQAQAILDLKLQKLTGLEREKIVQEWQALKEHIQNIKNTLADPSAIDQVIREELEDIRKRFSKPRLTQIESSDEDFTDRDLIAKEEIVVLITRNSGVKRILLEEYRLQKRGGVGVKGVNLGPNEDWVWQTLCVNTHTILIVLTNKGRLFQMDAFRIPFGTRTSKSRSIRNILPFESDEQVRSVVPIADFSAPGHHLCMVSAQGVFKKTELSFFARRWARGLMALGIKEEDQLVKAVVSRPNDHILIVTKKGMGVRFPIDTVRSIKSRQASGVAGVRLNSGDEVIGVHAIQPEKSVKLFTVSSKGYGKVTSIDAIRVISRGKKGVKLHKLIDRTGSNLADALLVLPSQQILLVTNKGQTIRFSCEDVSQKGRHTQGVKLIKLKEQEYVTGVSVIDEMEKLPEDSSNLVQ